MFVHRSNRTEALAAALSDVVRRPLASPLAAEVVVVSSQGLERWLAQDLASRLGVWANTRFPFPRAFMDELLGEPGEPGEPFRRESLAWAVADLLPAIAHNPGAEAVRSYLRDDEHDLKRFELARQIADVFDQYAVYRPELVRAWERGAGRGFQPDLWRAVVERMGSAHVASRAVRFLSSPVPASAPERVSVFGASTLPRIYVRVLAHLARAREVHLFLLCPTPGWDVAGNPLAESLGTLGREFELLLAEEAPAAVPRDLFVAPKGKTMLEVVQADLLANHKREPGTSTPRAVARPGDASIAVHSCHGPLREVEILRDQLLAAFESDPTLEPHDVIVMAPDIDEYAPLVDAIFDRSPGSPGFIPYRIADRRVRASNAVAEALARLLDLAGSRLKASDVLDLLQLEPVRDRFEIPAASLPDVRRLLQESGIRWGIDAAHRAEHGQSARDDNTWTLGVRRLLLGQALGEGHDAYLGLVPVPNESSALGELVGRIAELGRALVEWTRRLAAPRPMAEWRDALQGLLGAFVSEDEAHAPSVRAVRDAVDRMARDAALGGFTGLVSRRALTLLVGASLDTDRAARSFMTGGVTFCALLPMRSVPFRIVCLLGLGDTAFPRKDRTPAFDLVTHDPEPGDRSARAEDRQLFLEALLSARERFILSYVGRAAHDNALFPPSVVVAELMDVLDASFSTERERAGQGALSFADHRLAADGVGRRVLLEHPLQAFSPRYFGTDPDARLFSYGDAEADGARALATRTVVQPRFHVAPLGDTATDTLPLDELVRFLENPSRALIQRKLGVVLDDETALVADREPLELDGLGAYDLGARLFAQLTRGMSLDHAREWAHGLGLLPLGTPGEVDRELVLARAARIHDWTLPWCEGESRAPVEVAIELDGTTLVGVLRHLHQRAQVFARFARLKPKTELATWVRHLALSCVQGVEPRTTVVVGRALRNLDATLEARVFAPLAPEVARQHLGELLRLHRLGQKAPLCFFPTASSRFVEVLHAQAGRAEPERTAYEQARKIYQDPRTPGSDAEDAYVRRLFEHEDPFRASPVPFDPDGALGLPSFAAVARGVFEPLLAASTLEEA